MPTLRVFLDDQPLPVDTLEQWEAVDKWMRQGFQLLAGIRVGSVTTGNTTPATTTPPLSGNSGATAPTPPPPSRRSWPERAWLSLRRPATGEELYHAAIELGYTSTANNPVGAFKRAIRDNPAFVEVGVADNNAKLVVLKSADQTDIQPSSETTNTHEPVIPGSFQARTAIIPPKGQQVADYAEAVLKRAGQGMPIYELVNEMLADGWQTKSEDPEKRVRSVEVALYRAKGRFTRLRNGMWGIPEHYSQYRQDPIFSLDEATVDEENAHPTR